MLDNDFGEPLGGARCKETAEGSGIFHREWTNAHVSLDTNTNEATITMKPAGQARGDEGPSSTTTILG